MNVSVLNKGRIALIVLALALTAGIIYFGLAERRMAGERLGVATEAPSDDIDKAGDGVVVGTGGTSSAAKQDDNRSREETRQPTARP